ncbi:MAG: leucine-rich repeat domain-containing protein, partial [Clostridia bacterium]|nr:leucine-rich repeat domain-containing protein [Clostridia bacterium]
MKRVLVILFGLILLSGLAACEKDSSEPVPEFTDPGPVAELTWSIDETGTLTVSGLGAMPDYIYMADVGGEQNYPPWYSRRREILRVKLEPGLTRVGAMAFSGCSALWAVSLPEGIVEIGDEAFARTALEHCPLPESLERIGAYAFYSSELSGTLTLPERVMEIGDRAFFDCRHLRAVQLPAGLLQLGEAPFAACTALTEITIEENNRFCTVDGVLFTADMATLICYPPARAGEHYTVPDGVRGIADSAFRFCALTGVELPDSLLRIGREAFSYSAVTSIALPEGLLMIESYGFANCALTEICIPDSIEHLGNGIFTGCRALFRVNLPAGLETLPAQTFSWCTALCELNLPASLITIGSDAFLQCVSLT